ncbi:MAG TPA: TonB-dependent receptor [Albitalea sp.]|uniref:TonB-dependent receptor plug domain-containing protein n=1 Tax=Piscinibacter sp. TaxID=1903157 RepID=UPI002ED46748
MRHWPLDALCIACTLAFSSLAGSAELTEEEELAMAFGDKSFVSIATGARVPVTRAPAVATVITAQDIKALGATDLDQVLETVPGLHVARSVQAYAPIYTIRGIRNNLSNPQVLMLVNGIPVTMAFDGGRGNVWARLPLENVARIEVIRGPGSALYGADAFAGVINIITKTAADIAGTEVGGRVGSFRSGDAWALHGGKWGDYDVAAYLGVGSTRGARPTVEADAQSQLDAIFGSFGVPPVSRAPGPVELGADLLDAAVDVARGKWRLRAALKQRDRVGTSVGIAQALDPTGTNSSRRITADLGWRDTLAKDWDLSLQASLQHYRERSDLVLFPPGTNLGLGFFQDGLIGNPYKWQRHARLNASTFYTGFDRHRVRVGAGYENQDLYKIRETKNFNPDFSPIGSGSTADVVDVSDTLPFIRPHQRSVRYVVLQDEWNFSKDWTLTAGVRHDRYSDFGSTTNPRIALVWEAAYNLSAKLLYGTAFRPPAFTELYSVNNPVAIGNPALDAEKMKTLEAALSWQAAETLRVGVNVFRYRMSDIIRLDSLFTYQNTAQQTGHGLELEAAWDATRELRLSGNYGMQRATDAATGQDPGQAPHHHVSLRADWRMSHGWWANAQLNAVSERPREPGDPRPALRGYTTLDLTLRSERIVGPVDLAFSVRNLFDADAREPSPFAQPAAPLPNDLPLPGRSLYLQASVRF